MPCCAKQVTGVIQYNRRRDSPLTLIVTYDRRAWRLLAALAAWCPTPSRPAAPPRPRAPALRAGCATSSPKVWRRRSTCSWAGGQGAWQDVAGSVALPDMTSGDEPGQWSVAGRSSTEVKLDGLGCTCCCTCGCVLHTALLPHPGTLPLKGNQASFLSYRIKDPATPSLSRLDTCGLPPLPAAPCVQVHRQEQPHRGTGRPHRDSG